jgi:MFS family permease
MIPVIRSVGFLLLGFAMVRMGTSLLAIVLPLNMQASGHSQTATGAIMAAFFVGLMVGSMQVKSVIGKVGHIRAFAGFAALVAASSLLYPALPPMPAWGALRFVEGFCLAGLVAVTESWLNARSTNAMRGRVLGIYMLCAYSAVVLGQLGVNLSDVGGQTAFMVAAFFIMLSVVPVALTRIEGPKLDVIEALSLRELFAFSPLGVVGSVVAGLLTGAFYGMGPVLADRSGLSLWQVSLFMASVIGGGIAFQWPVGKLSDIYDRRTVLTVVLAALVAVSAVLAALVAVSAVMGVLFGPDLEMPLLLGLAALYGGGIVTIYPIAVAHTFDYLKPGRYIAASAGLLLFYSGGAALGPLLSAFAMSVAGPAGFFIFAGGVSAAAAAYTGYRKLRRAPAAAAERTEFVAVSRATPLGALLDPRTPPRSETKETGKSG